jgi:hypothetical protein
VSDRNGSLPVGAYGFRLVAERDADLADLAEVAREAPTVTVRWHHASVIRTIEEIGRDAVTLGARGASAFAAVRSPLSITFYLADPPAPGALVHPLLTVPISVLARWRGDATLHGGAFETESGAWAVMGAREAGKSTLLASLAKAGCPVVADDLLAIQGGDVWSGPRCVDLRPDVAERFSAARYLGEIGRRDRFRLTTSPARPRLPLRGILVPAWHDRPGVNIERLDARERLQMLYRQEYIALLGPADPLRIMDVLSIPAWRVTRPRDWAATDEVVERVLELARAQS